MLFNAIRTLTLGGALVVVALTIWTAIPSVDATANAGEQTCGSGKYEANLTGWPMDGKYPAGSAAFDQQSGQLTVSVTSVPLPDGTTLNVLIGDDRIGELEPIKNGEAKAVITGSDKVEGDSRVRVLNKEVPVVSGNLTCVEVVPTPTVSPTASPSPTVSPTVSPSPAPTVSPSPSPTGSPNPMPTATPFPAPTPSR